MIIDSLTHVTPDGRWFHTDHDASVDRLLREMDLAEVDKAVVVALAGYIDNAFVDAVCRGHQGRLLPGASVKPVAHSNPAEAVSDVKSLLSDGRYAVLKLHPRLNGYDPLDPKCLAVFDAVATFAPDTPVWLDSLFRSDRCLLSKPPMEIIHELAVRFPSVRIVLLHSVGANLLELAELVSHFDNLTLDISLTATYYAHSSLESDIKFLLHKRDRRLVAGSDFPEYTPSQYLATLRGSAREAGCSGSKLDNILSRNLANILHLKDGAKNVPGGGE